MTALAAFKIIFIQQVLSFGSPTASGKRQTRKHLIELQRKRLITLQANWTKFKDEKTSRGSLKSTDLESYWVKNNAISRKTVL